MLLLPTKTSANNLTVRQWASGHTADIDKTENSLQCFMSNTLLKKQSERSHTQTQAHDMSVPTEKSGNATCTNPQGVLQSTHKSSSKQEKTYFWLTEPLLMCHESKSPGSRTYGLWRPGTRQNHAAFNQHRPVIDQSGNACNLMLSSMGRIRQP